MGCNISSQGRQSDKYYDADTSKASHVFLAHNWGEDELGRNNHDRVSRINDRLKVEGLVTWFDSDRMMGNIVKQMTAGIDNTHVVVVFITKDYVEKVGGFNSNDNCQIEFEYAFRFKTRAMMLPVVMESRMRNTACWKGQVGTYEHLFLFIILMNGNCCHILKVFLAMHFMSTSWMMTNLRVTLKI